MAGDGHAVPFHLRVEVLVTAVPSLSPVNPFLAGDIVMLPCLVELLLQLGHGTAVAQFLYWVGLLSLLLILSSPTEALISGISPEMTSLRCADRERTMYSSVFIPSITFR